MDLKKNVIITKEAFYDFLIGLQRARTGLKEILCSMKSRSVYAGTDGRTNCSQ